MNSPRQGGLEILRTAHSNHTARKLTTSALVLLQYHTKCTAFAKGNAMNHMKCTASIIRHRG